MSWFIVNHPGKEIPIMLILFTPPPPENTTSSWMNFLSLNIIVWAIMKGQFYFCFWILSLISCVLRTLVRGVAATDTLHERTLKSFWFHSGPFEPVCTRGSSVFNSSHHLCRVCVIQSSRGIAWVKTLSTSFLWKCYFSHPPAYTQYFVLMYFFYLFFWVKNTTA